MVKTIETEWASRYEYSSGHKITVPTPKTMIYNIGLKTAGAVITGLVAACIGEAVEHIEPIHQTVNSVVESISGLDAEDKLSGLFALIGGYYGAKTSGVTLDYKLRATKIACQPFIEATKDHVDEKKDYFGEKKSSSHLSQDTYL